MGLYNQDLFNFMNKSDCWLDMKSQVGKESGTELVVGGMTAGGYGVVNNASLTNPTADVLRVQRTDTNNPGGSQVILTSGKRYRVTGEARSDGSAAPRVRSGTTNQWTGTSSTDWQDIDVIFTADSTSLVLNASASGAEYVEFRNISVQEIYQYTEDKSGKGNDFKLGDGTTASTFPAFSNPGFDIASGDYMSNPSAAGAYNNTFQTIVTCFNPDFSANDGSSHYLYDSTTGSRYLVLKISTNELVIFLGNTQIAAITLSTYQSYWRTHGLNVLVVSGTTGDNDVWLNGFKILDANARAWSPANPAQITIGRQDESSSYFDGTMYHFSTFGSKFAQKMSPIQVRQITQQLLNQYS